MVGVGHMTSMNTAALAVIATYNEKENVADILRLVLANSSTLDVLVVDDNSPDGTGHLVEVMASRYDRVSVLHRPCKAGLARALEAGFRVGIARGYKFIVNLDADSSHDPQEIGSLIDQMDHADLCIGSRYARGKCSREWPLHRLGLSIGGGCVVRTITGLPFRDPTSGFRCFRSNLLEAVLKIQLCSRGYCFHIETLHLAWRMGFRIVEVPITFANRRRGVSKLTCRIVIEAFWVTLLLGLRSRLMRSTFN